MRNPKLAAAVLSAALMAPPASHDYTPYLSKKKKSGKNRDKAKAARKQNRTSK
jgi:hypothetical protein